MKSLIVIISVILAVPRLYSQWSNISSFPGILVNDIIVSSDTLYVATGGSGVYISVNGGSSWTETNNGLSTTQALTVRQLLLAGNVMYAATVDGIYKSTNRGVNWVKKSTGIFIGGGATYEYCVSIFQYGGKLFTGAWTGIYSSSDGAEFWIQSNINGTNIMAKSFTHHQGILFAARESINIPYGYRSTDNGLSWNIISGFSYPMITFFSEGTLLWTGTIHGVWLSTNIGLNWESRSAGLPADPYNTSMIRISGTLVTSLKFGGSGVFRSSNNGLNWEDIGQGLPFLNTIDKLIVYSGKVIAATSQGLWQRNIPEIVVGIKNAGNEVPESFILYQNYPNPFNPSTKIKFSLPFPSEGGAMDAMLAVYDVMGREVETLFSSPLGRTGGAAYEIEWDASNYSSGVYYYRLVAGDYSETKKMILLK